MGWRGADRIRLANDDGGGFIARPAAYGHDLDRRYVSSNFLLFCSFLGYALTDVLVESFGSGRNPTVMAPSPHINALSIKANIHGIRLS